jgi:regulator of sirC expression with transglutaminase-like and TPR domain
MPDSKVSALINMLDDPDERVFGAVSHQLVSLGREVLSVIETTLENCFDDLLQERLTMIRDLIYRDTLSEELSYWSKQDVDDLLKGFIIASRTDNYHLDDVEVLSQLAAIRTDVWIELHDGLTAMENIKVINHVLYNIHRFESNKDDISAPENSYIHTLLKLKKGSPLTLGMIYLIICRQLGMPVYGVNLPQHFVLAYLTQPNIYRPTKDDILFYINPFNRGALFSRHEIDHFIGQLKIKPDPAFYLPCSNRDILKRLFNNLIFSFKSRNLEKKVGEIEFLLNTLS